MSEAIALSISAATIERAVHRSPSLRMAFRLMPIGRNAGRVLTFGYPRTRHDLDRLGYLRLSGLMSTSRQAPFI
jgi:hypothetical protein